MCDQKCNKCFVETFLPLTAYPLFYCFHMRVRSGIRRSVLFDLHSSVTVFDALHVCAHLASLCVWSLCHVRCLLQFWRGIFYIFYCGVDLFDAALVDDSFDDEFAKVECCFKVQLSKEAWLLISSSVSVSLVHWGHSFHFWKRDLRIIGVKSLNQI